MFDIGWSELLIIAVIAIIVVGPRELPRMLRTLGQYTRKMRSMAGEFKTQFNDAMEEADLADLKKDVESLKNLDPLKGVKDELSPFNSLGDDLKNSIQGQMDSKPAGASADVDSELVKEDPPKAKPKRRSSPRSAAQTNGSGKRANKPAKATTAKKPAKKPAKRTPVKSRKPAKPAKGEAVES